MQFCYKEDIEKVNAFIEKHRQSITEDLRSLVKIPSVRGEAMPDAPFGKACAEALQASYSLFEREGFAVKIDLEGKYSVSHYGTGNKTIGLFGHCDVVAADGEWLYGNPFELTEKDGFFIGRGCNDDKSGIIQMLYAAKIIRELKLPLTNRLLFFVGSCEEDGMEDISAFVKNETMPDASIVPDGEYPFNSGEKSRVQIMLESTEIMEFIKSIEGGKCYNIILDTVEAVLADGNKCSAKGITGHAAWPDGSENALKKFAHTMKNDERLSDVDKRICENVCEILADDYGTALGISHTDSVFGRLTCTNGIVTTVDGKLRMSLDVRHGISADGYNILETVKRKTAGMWNVIFSSISPGYNIDDGTPIAIALRNAYAAVSGDKPAEGKKCSGGTYARHLKNAFSVGTVMYCHSPKLDFPAGHGGVHQPDEAIYIDGFLESIKTLVCMIMEIDAIL